MTPILLISWLLVGVIVGTLNLTSQWWTIKYLQPDHPSQATALVWGGATLRWLLAAGVLTLALGQGLLPFSLVGSGLWSSRWVIILWMQHFEDTA